MVSRQETARPLLTPGEVMQLPQDEALVLVSGAPPIRAHKVRYFLDRALAGRVGRPPGVSRLPGRSGAGDWTTVLAVGVENGPDAGRLDEGGHRMEPELDAEPTPLAPPPEPSIEGELSEDEDVLQAADLQRRFRAAARQASLDPDDGIAL